MSHPVGRSFHGLLIAFLSIVMFINIIFLQNYLKAMLYSIPELEQYYSITLDCIDVGAYILVLPPYLATFDMLTKKVPWSVSNFFKLIWIIYLQLFFRITLIIAAIPFVPILLFLIPFNLAFFCFTFILFVDNLTGLLFSVHMSSELLSNTNIFLLGGGCLISGTSLYLIWNNIKFIMGKIMVLIHFLVKSITESFIDKTRFET